MIKGTTQLLGVIGDPVKHSLSPIMHNAAITHLGVDYVYLPFAIKPINLETAIAGFEAINLQGFNITIPHKQAIMPLLSEITPLAQAVGAVNTVWRTQNGWKGTNTDVEGFLAPLKNYHQQWQQKIAVILGNGGASRAVVAGCAELGFAEIHVVGRDAKKLELFQQSWDHSSLSIPLKTHLLQELPTLIPDADLLVNTTPIGMHPQIHQSPVDEKTMDRLKVGAIAYDLIYVPNPTLFLKQAKDRGITAIDGLEMLVQQGAAALQIWLQQPVPVDIMRQSLKTVLGI